MPPTGTQLDDAAPSLWFIGESPISGRGAFAGADITAGQVVFIDKPLVIGPRMMREESKEYECSVCLRRRTIKVCPKGCRLPVCEESPTCLKEHDKDCSQVLSLSPLPGATVCQQIYWALAPLRALRLSDKERATLLSLHANSGHRHGLEVRLLKEVVKDNVIKVEQESLMVRSCEVLDSVAFQVDTDGQGSSARAIYPVAGLLNHSCTPNTRHHFTSGEKVGTYQMVVVAAVDIVKGEELTTHYCPLLWGTPARRHYLLKTKHFYCECPRCCDPTEFGTEFSGLACGDNAERALPLDPLNPHSDWVVTSGGKSTTISAKHAAILQARYLRMSHLIKWEPRVFDQVTAQLCLEAIWKMDEYSTVLQELNEEELLKHEDRIRKILKLLKDLRLGFCNMRGLMMNQLVRSLKEKERRGLQFDLSELKEASAECSGMFRGVLGSSKPLVINEPCLQIETGI